MKLFHIEKMNSKYMFWNFLYKVKLYDLDHDEAIEKAVEARRHKPILLIDLAVPRDIELEASDLEDVFLYTVDDLGEIVKDDKCKCYGSGTRFIIHGRLKNAELRGCSDTYSDGN